MKKILLLVFITFVYAETLKSQEFYIGPKVGGNLSHIMYEGDNVGFGNNKMKLSSHIGLFAEIQLTEFFAIQPELLYSIKGASFDINEAKDYRSSHVYKYLSLPILAKYYIDDNFTIEGGPQFDYLLTAKNVERSDIYASSLGEESTSINLRQDMQVYDLGFIAGVGYLTNTGIYISVRYNMGLANISNHETFTTDNLSNGNIQLSVGFSMN